MVGVTVIFLLNWAHSRIFMQVEAGTDCSAQGGRIRRLQLHEIIRHGPCDQYTQIIVALFMGQEIGRLYS